MVRHIISLPGVVIDSDLYHKHQYKSILNFKVDVESVVFFAPSIHLAYGKRLLFHDKI